jgi:hypothetical protein
MECRSGGTVLPVLALADKGIPKYFESVLIDDTFLPSDKTSGKVQRE